MRGEKQYQELFLGIPFLSAAGEAPEFVSGVAFDSRYCEAAVVFVAIREGCCCEWSCGGGDGAAGGR